MGEEHKQKLLDIKLAKEAERSEKERQMEKEKEDHLRVLERERFNDTHENQKQKVDLEVKRKEMMLNVEKQRMKMERERLEGMKSLDVDLTTVLVAECRNADKTFKIESQAGGDSRQHFIFMNKRKWNTFIS